MNQIGKTLNSTIVRDSFKRSSRKLKFGGNLLACLGLLSFAGLPQTSAQTYDRVAPKDPSDTGIISPSGQAEGSLSAPEDAAELAAQDAELDRVLLDELKGLQFVDSADGLEANLSIRGLQASPSLEPLRTVAFYEEVALKYLGEPFTLRKLNALNREVVAFFRANDYPVVDVVVPEQDVTEGTVQLVVFVGVLGKVETGRP